MKILTSLQERPCVIPGLIVAALLIAPMVVCILSALTSQGPLSPFARQQIRAVQRYPLPPLWSPDGAHIVFNADATMHIVESYGGSLVRSFTIGDPDRTFKIAESVSPKGVIAFSQYGAEGLARFNPDRDFTREIKTASFDGKEIHNLTESIGSGALRPSWSPDGMKIAFELAYSNVIVMDVDDLSYEQITAYDIGNYLLDNEPIVWSPDGDSIAFLAVDTSCRNCPKALTLYLVNSDGSGLMRLQETVGVPAWSPDGALIAFAQHQDQMTTIYTVRPDGSALKKIASFPDELPLAYRVRGGDHPIGGFRALRGVISWSNDGSEIRLHQSPFVIVNSDGANLRIMRANPGAQASWSPSGDRMAVHDGASLFTMGSDGSNIRVMARRTNGRWEKAGGLPMPGEFEWTEVSQ